MQHLFNAEKSFRLRKDEISRVAPEKLGEGHFARIDEFDDGRFEIHVYKYGSGELVELGTYNQDGYFNKHGHSSPPELKGEVGNRLKGLIVDEMDRRTMLPDRGSHLRSNALIKLGTKIGVAGTVSSMISVDRLCNLDSTHSAC